MTTTTTRNGNLELTADFSKPLNSLRQEPTKHGKKMIIAKASAEPIVPNETSPKQEAKPVSDQAALWKVMDNETKMQIVKDRLGQSEAVRFLRSIDFEIELMK